MFVYTPIQSVMCDKLNNCKRSVVGDYQQQFFSEYHHPDERTLRTTDTPGARFSKAPETFRARKAIFRSSVCKNGDVYTPEISCIK